MTDEKKREAPILQDTQRLIDLVRYCRAELHCTDLITDEEYAELASITGSPARLRSYDAVTRELAQEREDRKLIDEAATKVDKQNAELREQLEQEREAVKQLRDAYDLMQHKVIACGVIAEGNGDCNPIYQPGGQWDSQQAEKVRTLVSQLSAARAALEKLANNHRVSDAQSNPGLNPRFIAQHAIEQIGWEKGTECP